MLNWSEAVRPEHFLGKEEVSGSNPDVGSTRALRIRIGPLLPPSACPSKVPRWRHTAITVVRRRRIVDHVDRSYPTTTAPARESARFPWPRAPHHRQM